MSSIHAMHNLSTTRAHSNNQTFLRVGVLALQGAFLEHCIAVQSLGVQAIEIRKVQDLENIHALILPGGESTVMIKLLKEEGLLAPLKNLCQSNIPILATCAGLILLAKKIKSHPEQEGLKLMDIEVNRNAFGRQIESFQSDLAVITPSYSHEVQNTKSYTFPAVFIRAPQIVQTCSEEVNILATHENKIVAVQQKNMVACAFHPELTGDTLFHTWLIQQAKLQAQHLINN